MPPIVTDIDIGFKPATLDEMLVDLHDAQRRYNGADANDMGVARQRIVHIVADIAGADLSPSEQQLAADILLSLLRQAEIDLRESLAERLCVMHDVPEEVILHLAHDVITVA
jgi:hypothetical protein